MAAFNASLNASVDKVPKRDLVRFQKMLALELLTRLVIATPVDTGRARGNWQLTIGKAATGESNSGNPAMAGSAVLAQLKPFVVVWLANNVPYIEKLNAGHSQQAPIGFFENAVDAVDKIAQAGGTA